MATARKVKQSLMEAQVRGTGVHEDEKMLERIRLEIGYDWRRPVGEYPYESLVRLVEILVEPSLKSGKMLHEAIYEIGCAAAQGFRETIIGRVSLAAAPMMKPLALLTKLINTFDAQTNYGQRKVEQISPQHVQIILIDEPGHPEWLRGVIETLLSFSSIKNYKVMVNVVSIDHKICDIQW